MAISTARVQINGTWYNLTKNGSTGKWEATVTAPSITSFNQPNKYYPVTVEATNTAGTTGSATATDPTVGTALRLVVKEKIKPVATITSPGAGAFTQNNKVPIVFTLRDESNGSGVDITTLKLTVDGTTYTNTSPGMITTPVGNGYDCTYTPPTALSDGSHSASVYVSDNDDNVSATVSVTFKIDTIPPVLNVSSPAQNLVTNQSSISVIGTTNDTTSSPVTVTITLNGVSVGAVTVDGSGNFTKAITLKEGSNTIIVTATDQANKASTVTRNVTLDTSLPKFTAVTIAPNPADAGASIVITVEVE